MKKLILLALLAILPVQVWAQAYALITSQRNSTDSGIVSRLVLSPYGTHAFLYHDHISRIHRWGTFGPNCTVTIGVLNCQGTNVASISDATAFGKDWLTLSDVGAAQDLLDIPTATSELTNDAGFLTESAVTSVNGQDGTVVIGPTDVGAAAASHTHDSSSITTGTLSIFRIPDITLSKVTDAGTSAGLNVATSGDATATQVVKGDDSRLTDARAPTSHSHTASDITDFDAAVDARLTGKEPAIPVGTTAQFYRGDKSWEPIDNSTVGLGNVDNTSDIDKPVSAAMQTALDGKADSSAVWTVGEPVTRTFTLATAYQCTAATRPCILTISLQSTSSISLSGVSNNEGFITLGPTSSVTSGTGTNIGPYKSNLGGGLVVGLSITNQQSNTYTVIMPVGYYVAVRQTVGSGLQVLSAVEQPL